MYRNKKYIRTAKTPSSESIRKRPLKTISENASLKMRKEDETRIKANQSIFDDDDMFNEPQSSEENIPASQEPSQRYLSQRSNFASILGRTNSWNCSARPPNTYFELVLTKAGVQLNEGDNFVLSCDHVSFVTRLREHLQSNHSFPENIEIFKTGFKQALEPKSKLALRLLSGCTIIAADDVVEHAYQSQESMVANFQMIDFLCKPVIDVLLDKIEKAACDTDSVSLQDGVPLLPLMLAQLRYVGFSHGQIIYGRIKRIFEKATHNGKMDVIANAELFVDASKHDEFTQMLLEHFKSSSDFFNATTITALTNLFLSVQMQMKLHDKICAYIIESNDCQDQLVPLLVNFMLKILSADNDSYICQLIDALRKILLHLKNDDSIDKPIQNELFSYIEQGFIRSKKFYTNWQKKIVKFTERQFCSIDFIVLLMLIHIREENSLYVENILRRKIKNENLSLNVLQAAKTKFPAVLEKYTTVLVGVLNNFLKEKNIAVANFAHLSYEILFQMCESVQKSILKKLLQLTNDKSTKNMANVALELLKNLQRKHPREIQNWAMLLMPLLDRLNEMTLPQTRLVMQLLCSIAYPPPTLPECPLLQDQISMLVKKQMICRNPSVRKQGLLGCAQLIDCIARFEEVFAGTEDQESSFATVGQIPDGRGRVAAQLFERVKSANMHCPQSIAFFYDELAAVLIESRDEEKNRGFLNTPFLMWINDATMDDFERNFIKNDFEEISISGVSLTSLKCINNSKEVLIESEEQVLSICLKISDLALSPQSSNATSSILVLSPTFNLLRVLCSLRSEGSLESVNSIIGCGISLPTFFDDENFIERIRNDFDNVTQKKIIDIYFHYANWLRTIISSFITQIDEMSRRKCLRRLNELLKIESKIRKLLMWAPLDYKPPKYEFMSNLQPHKARRGRSYKVLQTRKRTKFEGSKHLNATHLTSLNRTGPANYTKQTEKTLQLAVRAGNNSKQTTENFDNMYGPKEIYRQMEANIVLFLREKLNITMPFPAERIGYDIGLTEYNFVLADLVQKLESVLGIQKLQTEDNFQYLAKPSWFINDIDTQLRHIYINTKVLADAINTQLVNVNYTYGNVELFSKDFGYVRACFNFSLRLFAAFFSWPELSQDSQTVFLFTSLKKLCTACSSSNSRTEETHMEYMITLLFKEFLKYEPSILDLNTAVHLHNLLTNLKKFAVLNSISMQIASKQANTIRSLCKTFLQRKWYNYVGHLEKGARCNACLDVLVKGFLNKSDFKRLQSIINVIVQEVKTLKKRDTYLKSFPNFNRANFPILYRGLCESLLSSISDHITTKGVNYVGDKLGLWEECCSRLSELLVILREVEIPRNFQVFVKYAHMYLKLVLHHGLPHMEVCLRQYSDRILVYLKALQTITRFLHSLCCQAKVQINNTSIVKQIPVLRETMEALVFRVKAMLLANNCESAWDVGNLKNKDIHGEIILSQSVASLSAAGDEASDEEMPEDDVTVCESLFEPNDEEPASNIYANVRGKNVTLSKVSSRSSCI